MTVSIWLARELHPKAENVMNSPLPTPKPTWTMNQIVDALADMRDVLTKASLELREVHFQLDTAQRNEAIELTQKLVKKVNLP